MKNCTFICFMAAPRPPLGHYREDNLIHPMGRGIGDFHKMSWELMQMVGVLFLEGVLFPNWQMTSFLQHI